MDSNILGILYEPFQLDLSVQLLYCAYISVYIYSTVGTTLIFEIPRASRRTHKNFKEAREDDNKGCFLCEHMYSYDNKGLLMC